MNISNLLQRVVIFIGVSLAFAVKLWRGFAPPVIAPGDMASGAMNDPFAVIISAVMAATAVWVIMKTLFWLVSKIMNAVR